MTNYITGDSIKSLREGRGLTQRDLGERVGVTDKAVSKWETGRGLPDIVLVEPLATALGVSVAELLAGESISNANRAANMLRTHFYVCPICGNVIHSTGAGSFSCCGVQLPALEADGPDDAHSLQVEKVEHDFYVTLDHPMTKSHYISFIAYLTSDRIDLRKLYPEQMPEARFHLAGAGIIVACCNQHGLFSIRTPKIKREPARCLLV